MTDLTQFKIEIFKYTLVSALLIELISLPIIGIGTEFAYGIAVGTLVAIANFSIMSYAIAMMIRTKQTLISIVAYIIRLCLAAAVILITLKIGKISAFGALAGLFTVKIAIFYLHSIKKTRKTT